MAEIGNPQPEWGRLLIEEMKTILAFNGSPRPAGNTAFLLQGFLEGVRENDLEAEVILPHKLDLEYCQGCLRCNVLRRCSIQGDEWNELSSKIQHADVLVFASPVYFHHISAPMKKMMDRFRSFIHVQITETGLNHTPWQTWKKDFVLILSQGSPDTSDAGPVVDLFRFMTTILGSGNKLHVITATRLAVAKQVIKSEDELRALYLKLRLPEGLAAGDFKRNQEILKECKQLGFDLTKD